MPRTVVLLGIEALDEHRTTQKCFQQIFEHIRFSSSTSWIPFEYVHHPIRRTSPMHRDTSSTHPSVCCDKGVAAEGYSGPPALSVSNLCNELCQVAYITVALSRKDFAYHPCSILMTQVAPDLAFESRASEQNAGKHLVLVDPVTTENVSIGNSSPGLREAPRFRVAQRICREQVA